MSITPPFGRLLTAMVTPFKNNKKTAKTQNKFNKYKTTINITTNKKNKIS